MNKKLKFIFLPFLLSLMLFNTSFVFAEGDTKYVFEKMWPLIEQSWNFNDPRDIAVAPDNTAYVADTGNNQVKIFSAKGDSIGLWKVNFPRKILVAPDRSIYVLTAYDGIQQFNAQGEFIRNITLSGENISIDSMTIAQNGNIYITSWSTNYIYQYNSQGGFIRKWAGKEGLGLGSVTSAGYLTPVGMINGFFDIVAAQNGDIYVLDTFNYRIQQFNEQGVFIRMWGDRGSGVGEFGLLESITIAVDGSIYIIDSNRISGNFESNIFENNLIRDNRIQQFTAEGEFVRQWGEVGVKKGHFNRPGGVAVASNGDIYVADTGNDRIQLFTAQGDFIQLWSASSDQEGFFKNPYEVAVASDNSVYVSDSENHRIQHFTAQGNFINAWGENGSDSGQFDNVAGIAIARNGDVYTVDTGNNRIQQFSASGHFIRKWGVLGIENGQLDHPKGIAISMDGNIYVTDTYNNRIQQFNASGHFIRKWGTHGTGNGQLNSPKGIAVSMDGNVYVADSYNHRIQQFNGQGDFIREWGQWGLEEGAFNAPTGIVIASDNSIYVSDGQDSLFSVSGTSFLPDGNFETYSNRGAQNRIQKFSHNGDFIQVIGETGTSAGQFGSPVGIALASDNSLYIADTSNHRIQKLAVQEVTDFSYKAIILAGGGKVIAGRTNNIWDGTERVTKKAYNALISQGLKPHDIKFLTAGSTNIDLDNNKKFDDYEHASKESLRLAITEWAVDAKDVVIFLANHGGPGVFQINNDDVLSGEELNRWVTELETKISGKITIVIEACDSASFFKILSKPDRYLFSSAKSGEPAVISNNGLTSFSYYFWSEISTGHSLKVAFQDARQAMSKHQNAQKNADGLDKYCLGNCNSTASPPPDIISVTPNNTTLRGDVSQKFSMIVRHLKPLVNTWALIQRPDDIRINPNQPLNFKKIDLSCKKHDGKVAESICEGHYDKFDLKGKYIISFYVNDIRGDISTPETIDINQTQGKAVISVQYDEQQAIVYLRDVIVGGKHKQAALKQQGDKFVAFAINDAETEFSPAASFDTILNQLIIPHVLVLGENYKVTFNYLGGLNFQLQSITPK